MTRTIRLVAMAAMAALLAPLVAASPAEAAGGIRITKVYFDSPGADGGSNKSLNAEWVDIRNNGTRKRTLTGWALRDRGSEHVYRFPTFTLRPGATVRLHTGSGSDTAAHLYWDEGFYVWNNTGDTAILRNRAGTLIDRCRFTGAGSSAAC